MTAKLIIGTVLLIFGGLIAAGNWAHVICWLKDKNYHSSSIPFIGGINLTVGLFLILPEAYMYLSFLGLAADFGTLPILISTALFQIKKSYQKKFDSFDSNDE